ncbi:MAG: hypothetical protein NVS2B3_05810 [Vulcanimicrobiaceae bacterium]
MSNRLVQFGIFLSFAMSLTIASGKASEHRTFYTFVQAESGKRVYGTYCSSCHGADLRGPQAPLVGPAFVSLGHDNHMSMGTFFDFIVRDTPANSIGSLPHRDYVEIMAYILKMNGYAAGTAPLRFERAMRESTMIGAGR